MKFQTISLVTGTKICNAACPFCVSKMTGMRELKQRPETINTLNLRKALKMAELGGVTTAILTGKGEPTLYPEQIEQYLQEFHKGFQIPLIELQTNGWFFTQEKFGKWEVDHLLERWADFGLTTIMVSNCGYDPELNRQIYFPKQKEYLDLEKVVQRAHKHGLAVRLTTVGIKGGIDSPTELQKLMEFAQMIEADQVSWRPVNKPDASEDDGTFAWTDKHGLSHIEAMAVYDHVRQVGTPLLKLVHNAIVYDYKGQNLCMTSCLTHDADEETLRQLIFYPNGKLTYDWQYKGAVILRGRKD